MVPRETQSRGGVSRRLRRGSAIRGERPTSKVPQPPRSPAPTTPYVELIGPFAISGFVIAMLLAPVATSSYRPSAPRGRTASGPTTPSASGAAYSASPCRPPCSPPMAATSGQQFVVGMNPAVTIGAALAAFVAFAIRRTRQAERIALATEARFVTTCAGVSRSCAPGRPESRRRRRVARQPHPCLGRASRDAEPASGASRRPRDEGCG